MSRGFARLWRNVAPPDDTIFIDRDVLHRTSAQVAEHQASHAIQGRRLEKRYPASLSRHLVEHFVEARDVPPPDGYDLDGHALSTAA